MSLPKTSSLPPDTQPNRPAQVSRFRPSIAASVIRDQKKASNIFTNSNTIKPDPISHSLPSLPPPPTSTLSPFLLQLPFSPATIAGAALALAASINPMDHSHHHMDHDTIHHAPAEGAPLRHCSMNMIFNSDPIGTCIVFRQFYVSGTAALVGYLTLLFLLAVGYEYLRLATARFDAVTRMKLSLAAPGKRRGSRSPSAGVGPAEGLLDSSAGKAWGRLAVPRNIQLTRSLFYVSNVALSFFLMLVVMTYNAQIIISVLAGAFVGHFLFHRELPIDEQADKGMACH